MNYLTQRFELKNFEVDNFFAYVVILLDWSINCKRCILIFVINFTYNFSLINRHYIWWVVEISIKFEVFWNMIRIACYWCQTVVRNFPQTIKLNFPAWFNRKIKIMSNINFKLPLIISFAVFSCKTLIDGIRFCDWK